MAKPEDKMSLEQVRKLVDQLSDNEQEELRLALNSKSWGERWDRLAERIQSRFKESGTPIPTDDEVMAEVKAVREERKAKRA